MVDDLGTAVRCRGPAVGPHPRLARDRTQTTSASVLATPRSLSATRSRSSRSISDSASLAIDHLGPLLSALPAESARELLGHTAGDPSADLRPSTSSLSNIRRGRSVRHSPTGDIPLYLAGVHLRIRRATPARFYRDFAITRDWTDIRLGIVGAAAELASGVPAFDLEHRQACADLSRTSARPAHFEGWQELRRLTAPTTAHQWELLRRVHPLAQPIIAAMSAGHAPALDRCELQERQRGTEAAPRGRSRVANRAALSGCSPTHFSPRGPATMRLPGRNARASSRRPRVPCAARGRVARLAVARAGT